MWGKPIALYPAVSHIQIDYAPDGAQPATESQRELLSQITLRATESPAAIYRVEGADQIRRVRVSGQTRRVGRMECHCSRRRSIR